MIQHIESCTAFNGRKRIASGNLREVVLKAKEVMRRDSTAQVLIFNDVTSEVIDVDFREKFASAPRPDESPAPDPESRKPGRPKLGVVAREVTLLPRHWGWLASQPGGASVALRKLVEHAIKANRSRDSVRRAQESTYRFVSAMAGNEFPGAVRSTKPSRATLSAPCGLPARTSAPNMADTKAISVRTRGVMALSDLPISTRPRRWPYRWKRRLASPARSSWS